MNQSLFKPHIRQTLSDVLDTRSGITPKLALRLEKALDTPGGTWPMRQFDFELAEVMIRPNKIEVGAFRASTAEGGER